jgi:hypothetical protein
MNNGKRLAVIKRKLAANENRREQLLQNREKAEKERTSMLNEDTDLYNELMRLEGRRLTSIQIKNSKIEYKSLKKEYESQKIKYAFLLKRLKNIKFSQIKALLNAYHQLKLLEVKLLDHQRK